MSDEEKKTSETSPEGSADTKGEAFEDRDIKNRAKYKITKEELETLKITSEKEKNTLIEQHSGEIKKVAETNALLQNKVIETKIEAEAIQAGIKDLDYIKLMDKKDIKLNDDGSVVGAKEAIAALKTNKPDLFGSEKKVASSSNSDVPNTTTPPLKNAWDIPDAEWNQRMAKLR